ncbi:MAG: UDP-N-acetylmuramate--L-alanine ligase [Cyclobacteriaceae bacterium]
MNLDKIHSVYFVGIGGIGMSALARWFNSRGAFVAGYDRVRTPLTSALIKEGIDIHFADSEALIPDQCKDSKQTLVVYTPAIPDDHNELHYFDLNGFAVKKRSEVLGIITKDHYTVAVAGTHGKTTTSSMVAHLLHGSEKGCSAFVGGIMTNYGSNLINGDRDAPVVVEADEFDRSFLRLNPNFSVVTSLDPDHLDIYGDSGEMHKSYLDFMQLTDPKGNILLHENVAEKVGDTLSRAFSTYGLESARIKATNIRVSDGCFVFDYEGEVSIKDLRLQLPGFHNVSNAVAAITAALHLQMTPEQISERIGTYKGVKRRFEYVIRRDDVVYIDDYAHHPSEIQALLTSVRKLYPDKRITAVFQPHLYTRTRDFQEGFAESLSAADEVILLDIYPARELPILGITSQVIFDKINHSNKHHMQKEDFPGCLDDLKPEVLLTVGAGDIDQLVPLIKEYYLNNTSHEG